MLQQFQNGERDLHFSILFFSDRVHTLHDGYNYTLIMDNKISHKLYLMALENISLARLLQSAKTFTLTFPQRLLKSDLASRFDNLRD